MNKSFTVRQVRSQYGYQLALPTTINSYYVESSDIALQRAVEQSGLDASLLEVTENEVKPVKSTPATIDKQQLYAERLRRHTAPLNGNQGFSLLKQDLSAPPAAQPVRKPAPKGKPAVMRGYDIRVQRDGSDWPNEKICGALAAEGELPAEWETICADPSVVYANIFPSSQRTWVATKRRLVAVHNRASVTA